MVTTQYYYLPFYFIMVTNSKMAKSDSKTFGLDIYLDIYKCPFSKISVDFLTLFFKIMKMQGGVYEFHFGHFCHSNSLDIL